MNPINVLVLMSILFGASFGATIVNTRSLNALSGSYSLSGTGVYAANNQALTVSFPVFNVYYDGDLHMELVSGDYTINGISHTYLKLTRAVDGDYFELINGVCTQSSLPYDHVERKWSNFADTSDPNIFMHSSGYTTTTVTLGNNGHPAIVVVTETSPVPFTFTIAVTSYNAAKPPRSVFTLPGECVQQS